MLCCWLRFRFCAVGDGENEKDPARSGCLRTQDAGAAGKGIEAGY